MALDYEFAPVDVDIITHPKAFAAGVEAMGLWLWGTAFARLHKTRGRLPRAAVFGAWGGRRNAVLAKRLVDSGLWILRDDGDWDMWNYDKKSPPKSVSERVSEHRHRRRSEPPPSNEPVTASNDPPLPSISSSSDLEGVQGEGTGPPPWFESATDTVEFATGEKIDRAAAWLRYAGHRRANGKRMSGPDAQYWLTTVDVADLRKERQRTRERADTANARRAVAERPAPYHAVVKPRAEPPPVTQREASRLGELALKVLTG